MKKSIERALKRFLKGKIRIIETLIVCFLVNGSVSFSFTTNISKPEDYENYAIKFRNNYERDILQQDQEGNGIHGNIEDNKSTIKGEVDLIANIVATESYTPLKLSGNGITGEVKSNVGVVKGEVKTSLKVYLPEGVLYDNRGIIATSGNGIGGSIESNRGIVVGELDTDIAIAEVLSSNSPFSYFDLSFLGNGVGGNVGSNNGVIRGNSNTILTGITDIEYLISYINKSGNGVGGNVTSNTGLIQGKINAIQEGAKETGVDNSGNGVGMYVESNKGKITGKGEFILKYPKLYSYHSLGTIGNGVDLSLANNSGIISGNFTSLVTNDSYVSPGLMESGNGIHYGYTQDVEGNLENEDEKIDIIVKNNTGVIEGEAHIVTDISETTSPYNDLYVRGLGNGVHGEINYSNTVENNKGLIKGGIAALGEYTDISIGYSLEAGSGNGIFGTIKNNFGTVAGSLKVNGTNNLKPEFSGNGLAIKPQEFWGGPDHFKGPIQVKNSGFIGGSESAIAIMDNKVTGNITNYGIMAGKEIISDGTTAINYSGYQNYGIEIKINDDDERSIFLVKNALSKSKDEAGRDIINAEVLASKKDSYIIVDEDKEYKEHVINGAGVATGTLTLKDSKVTLDNTIINGYEKAITLNGDSTLVAVDSIFNGGGIGVWKDNNTSNNNNDDYFEYAPVIEGDSRQNIVSLSGQSIINGSLSLGGGNDTLTMSGNSIANGNLILGSGDDTVEIEDTVTINKAIILGMGDDELSISTGVQLNDNLYGEEGKDVLNLGDVLLGKNKTQESVKKGLNIYHAVSGFEDISIVGGVTLYETAKVVGAESIKIESDSSLNLRIDPTKTDDEGRVTGHALYGSDAVISGVENIEAGKEYNTDGGALNIVTNGLGTGGVIAMSDSEDHQVAIERGTYVRTDSIINSAAIKKNGDIAIKTGEDLDRIFNPVTPPTVEPIDPVAPPIPEWIGENHYKKLDKVYKSIVNSGNNNINALYPTVNLNNKGEYAAGENLLLLLNDIFMVNPYGYVTQASRETMGLFNEMVLDNPHSNQIQGSGWFMVA